MPSEWLYDHVAGCIFGGAIGDALGAPTEARQPEEIVTRFGGWVDDFAPPYIPKRPDGRHKGDGRITDDTLMVVKLCQIYLAQRHHLTAYDAIHMADAIMAPDSYVPEYGERMPLINRIFYPEKWLYLRLRLASADPREAGIGNAVNCGCAMYIAPVGIVNAGNPEAAYAEAIDWGAAHTQSYGREAAGVLAAAVAEALRPGATWRDAIAAAHDCAKDGTKAAIGALQEAARALPPDGDGLERARALRAAMRPFDTVPEVMKDYTQIFHYPSRLHSIEELPVALAYLAWAEGDYRKAALGAANYGRDSDSVASMAGAIAGAIAGQSALPARWVETVERENRLELGPLARQMTDLCAELYCAERERAERRHAALGTHVGG
jgi:ADP-ribosylglycohydrolase